MIVAEPNLLGAGATPFECDAELIIYTDRPFAGPITIQLMKPVAGRKSQIFDHHGCIKPLKSAADHLD